jgi:Uncharacterized stress protein (general stress protein 26)
MTMQKSHVGVSHDNLEGRNAAGKIREIVQHSPICFFVTSSREPGSSGARPMTVQRVDDKGNLWFISAIDTHKDQELSQNPEVTLYFQSSEHSEYLEIHGRASVSQDKQKIDELWHPQFDAWFDGGKEDPRVSVIRVEPAEGHYWDSEHSGFSGGMHGFVSNFFLQPVESGPAEGGLRP